MTLIAILVTLVIERFLGHLEDLREPRWFLRYQAWLSERLGGAAMWDGAGGVVAVLGPVIAAVAVAQGALGSVLLGLPGLVFAVLVLLYCLGPRNLDAQAEGFLEAMERDDEAAAGRLLGELLGEKPPEEKARWPGLAAEAVLSQANERVFGVLFWFALLGPVGAVLYRLAAILRRADAAGENEARTSGGFGEAAVRLYRILNWLPARAVVMGYALAGSFEDTVHAWREHHRGTAGDDDPEALLVLAGRAAIRLDEDVADDEQVRQALGLVWRTLVIWVTVIALLTLAGWAT